MYNLAVNYFIPTLLASVVAGNWDTVKKGTTYTRFLDCLATAAKQYI